MWFPAVGGDPSWTNTEESVIVPGLGPDDARDLGRELGQDAVFVWDADGWSIHSCAHDRRVTLGWAIKPAPAEVVDLAAAVTRLGLRSEYVTLIEASTALDRALADAPQDADALERAYSLLAQEFWRRSDRHSLLREPARLSREREAAAEATRLAPQRERARQAKEEESDAPAPQEKTPGRLSPPLGESLTGPAAMGDGDTSTGRSPMDTRIAAYLAELGSREGELFTAYTGENEGDDVRVVGVGQALEVRQSGAVLLKTTDIAGELAEFIDGLCDGEAVILSAEWNAFEVAFVMGQRCQFLDIDGLDWYQAQLIDGGYRIPYPMGDEARGLSRLARYDWAHIVEPGVVVQYSPLQDSEDSLHLLKSGPAYVVAANEFHDVLRAENDLDAVDEFCDGYVTEAEGQSEELWIRPDIASQLESARAKALSKSPPAGD